MAWFLTPDPKTEPECRLFCLPYAGGGAAVYRDWARELAGDIELRAVQLPGRGWRLNEAPSTDLRGLAASIAAEVAELADRPFALFGHSMGSWLAFLVARELEARGLEPLVVLVSGRQAPTLGNTHPPLSHLDDDRFVEEVQVRYGGIPPEILSDPEILELLLPALRADVEGLEKYVHEAGPPLSCPVVAMGGESDPLVPMDHLAPWSMETTGPFQVRTFPGDHFYFRDDPAPLIRFIEHRIGDALGVGCEGVSP